MAKKVIITCAVTGADDSVAKNPAAPGTPEQIATSSIDAAKAAAAAVHIHVRDPKTGKPSMEPALYRETVERIRASGVDVLINLTTGAGAPWGAPATTEAMVYMRGLLPPGSQWAAFGISAAEFPMAAQAVILGGHVRVGLEDNFYMAHGVLVERAVEIIRAIGAEVATTDEARHILSLPTR